MIESDRPEQTQAQIFFAYAKPRWPNKRCDKRKAYHCHTRYFFDLKMSETNGRMLTEQFIFPKKIQHNFHYVENFQLHNENYVTNYIMKIMCLRDIMCNKVI